jgi:chromosome segregation ATPase
MTKAFARVTRVVTEAETVWDEVTSRLDGIDDELGQARKQAAGLADDALTADVTAADEELRSLRSLLNSDPLALRQGDRVDTAGPDRLRARVSAAAARAGELARLRDDADRRIAGVGRAVAEAQAAGRDAAAARAEAAEKISAADLPWGPRADAGLAGTGLDRRLAAAQELRARGQWSRLAAEVASVEQAAAAAAERLRAAEREARWFLGQRHELWGRLRSYRAMADKLGGAEDPGLTTSYEQAEKLLVTTQCQLTAAADAVTRYQQAVLTFLGRGPGP